MGGGSRIRLRKSMINERSVHLIGHSHEGSLLTPPNLLIVVLACRRSFLA